MQNVANRSGLFLLLSVIKECVAVLTKCLTGLGQRLQ
jgi:hypothetical protein